MNFVLVAALALPLLAIGACAQSGAGDTSAAGQPSDAGFVQDAYQGGMAEVLAASYASSKADAPAIKAYASRMMSDHSDMDIGLRQLATAQGMTVPTSPSDAQIADVNATSKESGAAFDKSYVATEVARHKTLLQTYQTESASGTNTALKQYAADRLPVIQSHLSAALSLAP